MLSIFKEAGWNLFMQAWDVWLHIFKPSYRRLATPESGRQPNFDVEVEIWSNWQKG